MPKAQATPGKTLISPADHTLIGIARVHDGAYALGVIYPKTMFASEGH